MSAEAIDFLLRNYDSIADVEASFERLTHCTNCQRLLARELVYRRAYELRGGSALVILCDGCNTAIPVNSQSDFEFRQRLERMARSHEPRNLQ